MIYLDNAATSFPKPSDCLQKGLARYLALGASPGRGGYDRAVQAEEAVAEVRGKIAQFFEAGDQAHVCFAANATDALNILLQGLILPGDHIISTRLEHNSVLRPLNHLREQGHVSYDLLPFNRQGFVDPQSLIALIKPETRLVVMTHGSNVLGTIQDAASIGEICRKMGVPLILDVAQTAGIIPISMEAWGVQGLTFTGHKSLLGPTGIGGMVLAPDLNPRPTRFGGTGVDSHNPLQPDEYPYRLEAGTINLCGILTLGECIDFVNKNSADFHKKEMQLLQQLLSGLQALPRVKIYGVEGVEKRLPVLACTVDGIAAPDVGAILDGDFGIAVRTGQHCAPLVHQDFAAEGHGMIRFSIGPYNTSADIEAVVEAMAKITG